MDGAWDRDLAVAYGAQLRYRRMNHHEEASARAYSRRPGAGPLRTALEDYERAVQAFNSCQDAVGRSLLRRSVPVIQDSLGMAHPFAVQATATLAGRLRDEPGSDAERCRLYQAIARAQEALYGADHLNTLRALCDHASLLRATCRTAQSIAAFQRVLDGSVRTLSTLGEDVEIDVGVAAGVAARIGGQAYESLLGLIPVDEHDERLGAVEDAVLALAPPGWFGIVIREARLSRHPDLRWAFYARITEVLPTIRPETATLYWEVRTGARSAISELSERIARLRSDADEPTALIGSCLAALLHERLLDPPVRAGLDESVRVVPDLVIEVFEAAEYIAAGCTDDRAESCGCEDVPTPVTDARLRRHHQILDELWCARPSCQ